MISSGVLAREKYLTYYKTANADHEMRECAAAFDNL
jgi:hypothetical protein